MTRHHRVCATALLFTFVSLLLIGTTGTAFADHRTRRARRVVETRARVHPASTSTLGTFYPTPVLMVRGNSPIGGGYSPLDIYGDQTMALYGPLSPMRFTTAPVLAYVRGYDGQIRVVEASTFSSPNLPEMTPVNYPTEANYFWGPRVSRTPPWGSNAINWIDQN